MTIVNPGGGDIPEIEDGLYQATVLAVRDVVLDEPDQYGNDLKVEIQIGFAADGAKHTLEPRVNMKWGEKATLYTIAVACGCNCNPNTPFDTDDLLGKRVGVLVETTEAGKWPRVKSWVKADKRQKADPPGLAQAWEQAKVPAAESPSVLKADGSVEWSAFWMAVKRLGATRESVATAWGGNLDNLTSADGVEVAAWLQEWAEKVNA